MENFDFEKAIMEKGVCIHQTVKCENCSMGRLIFEAGYKDRIMDMCNHRKVYSIALILWPKSIEENEKYQLLLDEIDNTNDSKRKLQDD